MPDENNIQLTIFSHVADWFFGGGGVCSELTSHVYKAKGMSAVEILSKAKACIGERGGKITVESDTSITGNARVYVKRYWVDVPYDSIMTLEAREGRFRIKHTGIKVVYKDDAKKVDAAINELDTEIAKCISTESEW